VVEHELKGENMSELGEKRRFFTKCLVMLLTNMLNGGFKPMIGKDGLKHMEGSLHFEGLAVDIDLCDSEGNYLPSGIEHRQFGELWESLGKDCTWGGRFKDSNHYSVTYLGRK
jgi:hypothetical protein